MLVRQYTILNELSHNNNLKGRILIYGGDKDAISYWCTDFFDPLYHPHMPDGKYDTIVCSYILCFLTPVQRRFVLNDIQKRLCKGGVAYFTVKPQYHLPFKLHCAFKDFTIYRASHRSLKNWGKIYESRALVKMMETYLERKDVQWKEWTRASDPVTAQLSEDFQVIVWREGGHRPDEEMFTKLRFAQGQHVSFDIVADGQLWRSAYHQSTPCETEFPFPTWRASAILELKDCRELLDAVIKEATYTKELSWVDNY